MLAFWKKPARSSPPLVALSADNSRHRQRQDEVKEEQRLRILCSPPVNQEHRPYKHTQSQSNLDTRQAGKNLFHARHPEDGQQRDQSLQDGNMLPHYGGSQFTHDQGERGANSPAGYSTRYWPLRQGGAHGQADRRQSEEFDPAKASRRAVRWRRRRWEICAKSPC